MMIVTAGRLAAPGLITPAPYALAQPKLPKHQRFLPTSVTARSLLLCFWALLRLPMRRAIAVPSRLEDPSLVIGSSF